MTRAEQAVLFSRRKKTSSRQFLLDVIPYFCYNTSVGTYVIIINTVWYKNRLQPYLFVPLTHVMRANHILSQDLIYSTRYLHRRSVVNIACTIQWTHSVYIIHALQPLLCDFFSSFSVKIDRVYQTCAYTHYIV